MIYPTTRKSLLLAKVRKKLTTKRNLLKALIFNLFQRLRLRVTMPMKKHYQTYQTLKIQKCRRVKAKTLLLQKMLKSQTVSNLQQLRTG